MYLQSCLLGLSLTYCMTEIEDDDEDDDDRVNGASGDHERNNDSIFAELSRGKFGLEEIDDGASITGERLKSSVALVSRV